ncbi:MAG: hypothetical protein NTZ39_00295 [Methanoregula sp.]|nr:hypothetical protein [Methanoregula sp.]
MSWAALTFGGKDSVLACQKAIDSGKDVECQMTVRLKNRASYMFHSANLDAVPVMATISGMKYTEILIHGRKEEELADLEKGLSTFKVEGIIAGALTPVYHAERLKAIADRHELILGGFA